MEFEELTFEIALQKCGISERPMNLELSEQDLVLFFEGDLSGDGSLILPSEMATLVNGSISATGLVFHNSPFVVTGDINAKAMATLDDCLVKGTIKVEEFVYGKSMHNKTLDVGEIIAKAVIDAGHEFIVGNLQGLKIGAHSTTSLMDLDFDSEHLHDIFIDEVFDIEGHLDPDILLARAESGQPWLRKV